MLTDLRDFGTERFPLRASRLPGYVECTLRNILVDANLAENTSGVAADTGSAVHFAVKHFHLGAGVEGALKLTEAVKEKEFPQADMSDAERQFRAYTSDPRNIEARIILLEEKITFTLDPAEEDPTGEPIVIIGTLDQVREERGKLHVWDLKTSARDSWEIATAHTLQLAAYVLGAHRLLQRDVEPGGLIATRGYFRRGVGKPESEPNGVFLHVPWQRADALTFLDAVRNVVARVRGGYLTPNTGKHCNFCPVGGISLCLAKLRSLPSS